MSGGGGGVRMRCQTHALRAALVRVYARERAKSYGYPATLIYATR